MSCSGAEGAERSGKQLTGARIGVDDLLLLDSDAGGLHGLDAQVVLPARAGSQDDGVQGVAEVAEQQGLVLQGHGQHPVQPLGHLLDNVWVLLPAGGPVSPPVDQGG